MKCTEPSSHTRHNYKRSLSSLNTRHLNIDIYCFLMAASIRAYGDRCAWKALIKELKRFI